MFDIYKTHSLQKLSDVLSQVVSMSSVASQLEVQFTAEQVNGISMINQNLFPSPVVQTTASLYKVMSLGFDTNSPFTIHANVDGYTPMTLFINPVVNKVEIKICSKAPVPSAVVSLRKGQKVSLTKTNPQLNELYVGLGWDVLNSSQNMDLDAHLMKVSTPVW